MRKIIYTICILLPTPILATTESNLYQLSQKMEALAHKAQREFIAAKQERQDITQDTVDEAKEHLETLKEKTQELQEKADQMIEELKNQ